MFYNKKIFKRCFHCRGKYWFRNIKYIPVYFRCMYFLIKHGYDEYATWETSGWFIDTMKEILSIHRHDHVGYPVVSLDDRKIQEEFEKEYDADLDKMISLLDDMDSDNSKYLNDEYRNNIDKLWKEQNAAKDEFFELFSKHFYSLWD